MTIENGINRKYIASKDSTINYYPIKIFLF